MSDERVCLHGGLRRQCEACDLAERLDAAEWVCAHAMTWWQGKRPLSFTEAEHRENPTINTVGPNEAQLAEAVEKWSR